MQKSLKHILTAVPLALCLQISAQSIDQQTLKAIWIEKFTHFIKWPKHNNSPSEYFTIAAITPHTFENTFEDTYSDIKILDKEVRVLHINSQAIDSSIQILYIPPLKNKKQLDEIIDATKEHNILLISDSEGYAEKGTHINFFLDNQQIRFEINESAIHNSNFFVSYRLLNIAHIIEPLVNE